MKELRTELPEEIVGWLTDAATLFELVRTAFGQRRKMLRRSLADRVTAEQFAAADVSPTSRPEELDVEAWVRLTRAAG